MKKLRTGFTTGSCAQAAAKASVIMLNGRKKIDKIEIETPSGKKLSIKLFNQEIGKDFAECAVVKDAGDDIDITNKAKIYAKVLFSKTKGITITGGEGIGKVTKPGLPVPIGKYAINPVPRKMIVKELTPYLSKYNGFKVVISVPKGKELAKRTFNPKLGIIGGISIIGTTGEVIPKSMAAYKSSLSMQLNVLKASGYKRAVLVLGYVGEKFCKEKLKIKDDEIIKIGDFVGFMLKECVKKQIKNVLLVGYLGKLIKVANGQFNTNIKFGDNRIKTIAKYVRVHGADKKVIGEVLNQTSAEATIDILKRNNLNKVFDKIAYDVVKRINNLTENKISVGCIVLSLNGGKLASYE